MTHKPVYNVCAGNTCRMYEIQLNLFQATWPIKHTDNTENTIKTGNRTHVQSIQSRV